MLTRIKKIKSLGVFADYTAAAELPAFGRFNVVYGENGSGKTTLSRLLACLEAGAHPDHPDLEYAVESQSGALTHGTKYLRGVRVFNSDYVDANIGRFEGPLRHILIIGEENKAVAEELKTEIATREDRSRKIAAVSAAVAKIDSDKGKLFSQIAKTIGEATSGSTLRSYRKPDAEAAFGKLDGAKSLTDEELEVHRATVRQEQMAAVSPLNLPSLVIEGGEITVIDFAANAGKRAEAFLLRSAQAAVIERLVKNPAIASWVDERSGVASVIESLVSFPLPDRLAFYSELRASYDTAIQQFAEARDQQIAQLGTLRDALNEKLTLRTTSYSRQIDCDTAALSIACDAIQSVIKRHQDKTASFDNAKKTAEKAIEAHYLLTIKDQVDGLADQAAKLSAKAFRRDIIEWRNRWANRPRSADYAIQVLQRVLSWSVENALIDENPAAGIKGLYSPSANSRAHVIVEPHELEAVLGHMSKHAALAVRLAAETGLRRGDLVDLRWNELRDTSIERVAQKSRRGRRVIVPLTREAQAVIAELREMNRGRAVPSTHVLFSRQGPWTGIGLGSVWWKACQKAGVDKHFHDLRGTAATRFCMVPFSDEEVADIMGWEPGQVRVIRKRYVDRERIAAGLVARMEQAQKERG